MFFTIHGKSKKTRKQREKERLAWKEQQEKYKIVTSKGIAWTPEVKKSLANTLTLHRDRLTNSIPSRDSGLGVGAKKQANTYTGDKLIGIGNLHKSNLVPVFKEEEARDLSSMRR